MEKCPWVTDATWVREVLAKRSRGDAGWEVTRMNRAGFVAVGCCEHAVEEVATASFVLAEGGPQVSEMGFQERDLPKSQDLPCHLRLVGVPLIYCDKAEASLLVGDFRAVVAGITALATEGRRLQ